MIGTSVTAASLYADLVVAPLNPDKFSAKGLHILKTEIEHLKKQYKQDIKYKVFLNKFSGNTLLSDKAIHTTISTENELGNALSTAIRQSQEIPNATDNNLNIFSSLKKSISRQDFNLLTRELLNITFKNKSKPLNDQKTLTM
jgi:chromosome partitioning protein